MIMFVSAAVYDVVTTAAIVVIVVTSVVPFQMRYCISFFVSILAL